MRTVSWIPVLALLCPGIFLACQPNSVPEMEQTPRGLAHALGGGRLLEVRISGGYSYVPCLESPCSAPGLCERQCAALPRSRQHISTASLSLLEQAHRGTASERQTRALATLILDRKETDAAVEVLEVLRDEQPHNPSVMSDLGAAYLVRAQRQGNASDVPRALEMLTRAVELDGNLEEARFNRALAFETLLPGREAIAAWGEFKELAESWKSEWVSEAEGHMALLQGTLRPPWPERQEAIRATIEKNQVERLRDLVSEDRVQVRSWAEELLLLAWIDKALNRGAHQVSESPIQLLALAACLKTLSGDGLLEEGIGAVRAAAQASGQRRLQVLTVGHRTLQEARNNYESGNSEAALGLYRKAARALEAGVSPFQYWAKEGEIVSLFQLERLEDAESLTHQLLEELPPNRWPLLTARLTRLSALFLDRRGRPLEALRKYQAAMDLYEAMGEQELWLSTRSRRSDLLRTLGVQRDAWDSRLPTLRSLELLSTPGERYFVLHEASQAALESGLLATARMLMDAASKVEEQQDKPLLAPIALRYQAEFYLRAGDLPAASRLLKMARAAMQAIPDGTVKRVLSARILQVEGMTLIDQDAEAATAAFRSALERLPHDESLDLRAEIRYQWAQNLLRQNRASAAAEQLSLARQNQEALWQKLLAAKASDANQEEITFSYFDYQAKIRDLSVELLIQREKIAEALAVLEWSKAREPLERLAKLDPQRQLRPLSGVEILAAIPENTTVFQYLVLEDHIKVWRSSQGELLFRKVLVSRKQLKQWNRAIRRYTEGLDKESVVREVLSRYRQALVPPDLGDFKVDDHLVFIPHQELHGVPFAALLDKDSRFLVESHPILTAPSLTFFVHEKEGAQVAPASNTSALLVGDPAFDANLFPRLRRLPGSLAEVESLAELYPDNHRLLGSAATADEVLRRLPEAEVFHFAGHALTSANSPSSSLLALAASGRDTGVVYAEELVPLNLPRTRVVVLSACTTTGGYPIGSLGASGLVRPFLAAGVPAVVATLWDVRDGVGTRFFSEFHKNLLKGEDAASALQHAQLVLMRHTNEGLRSVASWAAYSLAGNVQLSTEDTLQKERKN